MAEESNSATNIDVTDAISVTWCDDPTDVLLTVRGKDHDLDEAALLRLHKAVGAALAALQRVRAKRPR